MAYVSQTLHMSYLIRACANLYIDLSIYESNKTDFHLNWVQTNELCEIELFEIELFDHLIMFK